MLHYLSSLSCVSIGCLEVRLGRPQIDDLVTTHTSAAFFCGGPGLQREVEKACSRRHVPLSNEIFLNRSCANWTCSGTLPFLCRPKRGREGTGNDTRSQKEDITAQQDQLDQTGDE